MTLRQRPAAAPSWLAMACRKSFCAATLPPTYGQYSGSSQFLVDGSQSCVRYRGYQLPRHNVGAFAKQPFLPSDRPEIRSARFTGRNKWQSVKPAAAVHASIASEHGDYWTQTAVGIHQPLPRQRLAIDLARQYQLLRIPKATQSRDGFNYSGAVMPSRRALTPASATYRPESFVYLACSRDLRLR
jgi:hypothetical protein